MKMIENKFVGEPASYAPPMMWLAYISNSTLLCESGSEITDASEDSENIF